MQVSAMAWFVLPSGWRIWKTYRRTVTEAFGRYLPG